MKKTQRTLLFRVISKNRNTFLSIALLTAFDTILSLVLCFAFYAQTPINDTLSTFLFIDILLLFVTVLFTYYVTERIFQKQYRLFGAQKVLGLTNKEIRSTYFGCTFLGTLTGLFAGLLLTLVLVVSFLSSVVTYPAASTVLIMFLLIAVLILLMNSVACLSACNGCLKQRISQLLRETLTIKHSRLFPKIFSVAACTAILFSGFSQSVADTVSARISIYGIVVLAAAVLAFVMFYFLNTDNIDDKSEELSVMRIYGFTEKELRRHICRSEFFPDFIGIITGIFMGVLHALLFTANKSSAVTFVTLPPVYAGVLSVALTILFLTLSCLLSCKKLKYLPWKTIDRI